MNAGKLSSPELLHVKSSVAQNPCDHRLFLSLGPGGAGGEASHAFGHYWFHIRGVSFIQGLGFNIEVWITFWGYPWLLFLQVGVIRPYVTSDNQSCWKCKQREKQVCERGETIKSTFYLFRRWRQSQWKLTASKQPLVTWGQGSGIFQKLCTCIQYSGWLQCQRT